MISHRAVIRLIFVVILGLFIFSAVGITLLLESKTRVFNSSIHTAEESLEPFPVSVDPANQLILEESLMPEYNVTKTYASNSWWRRIVAVFMRQEWYQNLASPVSRVFVIWPGERKEEVAEHISAIMRWNEEEKNEFLSLVTTSSPSFMEGKFYPGEYVAHRGASPEEVALLIQEEFEEEILDRYTPTVKEQVPLKDALIIASLLEREASDFQNMREVSGVIWNRLFSDMPLQLDASLQYVRGSDLAEPEWWPTPVPDDKYLDSPFNTYQNPGLPPSPISNPSSQAVIAALNPRDTKCLFYFHDNQQNYYCSETYEEHVSKLKNIFGQGS